MTRRTMTRRTMTRQMWRMLGALAVTGVLGVVGSTAAGAQRGGGGFRGGLQIEPNVPYDGRLTWVRVRYDMGESGRFSRGGPPWSHDYPRGERHFMKIISELSTTRTRTQESNILTLDDPQLGKFPVALMAEPGFWRPSDAEATGLRNYLTKGGFIIFDDFTPRDWLNLTTQMGRVFPKLRPIQMTVEHPIFDAFYRIKSLNYNHPYYGGASEWYGWFEDNDPKKRLLAIADYNNDISEYWEFSDTGMFPIDLSNDAYKIGVNYVIYALTR